VKSPEGEPAKIIRVMVDPIAIWRFFKNWQKKCAINKIKKWGGRYDNSAGGIVDAWDSGPGNNRPDEDG
jgi:hypothetical protein